MEADTPINPCAHSETTSAFAVQALSPQESAGAAAHIGGCRSCLAELQLLRAVTDRFTAWPRDILSAPASLGPRLAARIDPDAGTGPDACPQEPWSEPGWEQVAEGVECKVLAADPHAHRVSMIVRLAPGASYPAHVHADREELHLLDGELWIDETMLKPGGYYAAAEQTSDTRVWTKTGCTCVLTTSTKDILT
ncbi:MAG: cupin domain-containing protein [Rhodospirillaceae bacterium]